MRKKAIWLVSAIVVVCGLFFYHQTYFSYKTLNELHHFPVPRYAKLVDKSNIAYGFNWPQAKEEDGIPYGYKFILKRNGWVQTLREGSLTEYQKGDHRISLICTNQYLKILLQT
ncbi:hypothetical protein ACFSMW_19930 [Virgibacillus halophilus]|uniref:hypothetical protein n=1 Tax=Tigheibacillus halophilus TaxID=361280 RepID=UPI00363F9097